MMERRYYEGAFSSLVSGKIILLTKEKIIIDTPPLNTIVPRLYTHSGTNLPVPVAQMQLMELTMQVMI